ncbi:MAG: lytic transglycosylase domain-containing protein [Acidimicrobiia bacterium]
MSFKGLGSWRPRIGIAVGLLPIFVTLAAMPNASEDAGVVPSFAGDSIVGLDQRVIGLGVKAGTFTRAQADLTKGQAQAAELLTHATDVSRRVARVNDRIGALEEIQRRAQSDQDRWRAAREEAIAALYMNYGTQPTLSMHATAEREQEESQHFFSAAAKNANESYLGALHAKERAIEEEAKREAELVQLSDEQAKLTEQWNQTLAVNAAAEKRMRASVSSTIISSLDIPLVTLDAYLRAERAAAFTLAKCQLPWWALAGIGKVESNHARYRGSFPDARGHVSPPIIGAALDGTGVGGNTIPIPSPDAGALSGDPIFDHALGPMQFITSTWMSLGSDGNGDRVRDPQNVYDATLAAAKLLCQRAPAGGLQTDDALRAAFKRYNNSDDYANLVLSRARKYQQIGLQPDATSSAQ